MELALLAHSLVDDYTRVRIYFETCFADEPKYRANIMADRLASLFKMYAEIAVLRLELDQKDEAVEALESILSLMSIYSNGSKDIIRDVLARLGMIYGGNGDEPTNAVIRSTQITG